MTNTTASVLFSVVIALAIAGAILCLVIDSRVRAARSIDAWARADEAEAMGWEPNGRGGRL